MLDWKWNKQMKSIITRLEARSQQSIVMFVAFRNESTKEMGVAEFKELPKEQSSNCEAVRIVSGNNLKEFDEYIDIIMGMLADIINNPVPNRNIEDYE